MKLKMVTTSVVLANMLFAQTDLGMLENFMGMAKNFPITGAYSSYDFEKDGKIDANDWVFKFVKYDGVYRLLGNEPTQSNLFGWKRVDIVPNEPQFFMINLGDWDNDGDKRFDWLVLTTDGKSVYKLDGVTDRNTFKYSKKLNISFDIDLQKMIAYVKMPDMQILPTESSTGYAEDGCFKEEWFLTKYDGADLFKTFSNIGNITKMVLSENVSGDSRYYLIDRYSGLKIWDTDSEDDVNVVATFDQFNNLKDIAKYDNYIFAVDDDGVKMVDITDENSLKIVKTYLLSNAKSLEVKDGLVYVFADDGLKIVDKDGKLIGDLKLQGVKDGFMIDRFAYILTDRLVMIDVSNPKEPIKANEVKIDEDAKRIFYDGDDSVIITTSNKFIAIVVEKSKVLGKLEFTLGYEPLVVKVNGDFIFVAKANSGVDVYVYDDSSKSLKLIDEIETSSIVEDLVIDIYAEDRFLITAEGVSGMSLFEIKGKSNLVKCDFLDSKTDEITQETAVQNSSDAEQLKDDNKLKKIAKALIGSRELGKKSVENVNSVASNQISTYSKLAKLRKIVTRDLEYQNRGNLVFDSNTGDYKLISDETKKIGQEIVIRFFNAKTGNKIECDIQTPNCLMSEGLITGSYEEMDFKPDFKNMLMQIDVYFSKPIENSGVYLKLEKLVSDKSPLFVDDNTPANITWRSKNGTITLQDGTTFNQDLLEVVVDPLNVDRYDVYSKISGTIGDKSIIGEIKYKDGKMADSNIVLDGKSYKLKEAGGDYIIVDEEGNKIDTIQ